MKGITRTDTSLRTSSRVLARLLETPDLGRIVRRLPNQRFAELVREVGLEDAGELVHLASTEQLVAALDEDLFVSSRPGEREVFDATRFVTWLEVLLEGGEERVAQRMTELSEDFLVYALSQLLFVFDSDELRVRVTGNALGADRADKALEAALSEEIDGYFLVARAAEGWDATLSLILALDRSHRPLLVRLLDRCAAIDAEVLDDLSAFAETLTAAESLAEDVEADRQARRSRLGFVEPRAARSFLALARRPFDGPPTPSHRDPVTRAYFRDLDRAHHGEPTAPRNRPEEAPWLTLSESASGRALPLAAGHDGTSAGTQEPSGDFERIRQALHRLSDESPRAFSDRLEEIAYLSNVLATGATTSLSGERLDWGEAAHAALGSVARGAELEVRRRQGGTSQPATIEELAAVLEECPADLLFRMGYARTEPA